MADIRNIGGGKLLAGTSDYDSIYNVGYDVTIDAGAGKDSLTDGVTSSDSFNINGTTHTISGTKLK